MAVGFPDDGAVDWFDDTYRPFLRAMEGRALSLHRLGRSDEAVTLFENLADMNPADYAGCRYLAGEIRHGQGDLDGAIANYRLVPVEPAVLYNLGLAYFQSGDRAEAASVLIKAFSMNRYIVAHLLDRAPSADEDDIPGFLASAGYADEFVTACGHLWTSPAARHFLARVYNDPLVQTHLRRCVENVGSRVMSAGPAALTEDVVQSELDAQGRLGSLVRRVLEQLDS
jgi:tetratricopeptide (TPR) repeat protein